MKKVLFALLVLLGICVESQAIGSYSFETYQSTVVSAAGTSTAFYFSSDSVYAVKYYTVLSTGDVNVETVNFYDTNISTSHATIKKYENLPASTIDSVPMDIRFSSGMAIWIKSSPTASSDTKIRVAYESNKVEIR